MLGQNEGLGMNQVFDTPKAIKAYRLIVVIKALRLEMRGLRHSRGSVAALWRQHYGMSRRAPIECVIARVQEDLDKLDQE